MSRWLWLPPTIPSAGRGRQHGFRDGGERQHMEHQTSLTVKQRKGWKFVAVLLLIGAYLALQWVAALLKAPGIDVEPPENRQPFAVDFALSTLQGNTVRLADLRGQVVLLNFWATWCYPCRSEMPSLNELYRDYQHKGFEILAVASDEQGREVVAPFVKTYALTFPILLDRRNVVGARLHLQGIPTTYVVDKQGRVAGLEVGARDWNKAAFRRFLDQLLAEERGQSTP